MQRQARSIPDGLSSGGEPRLARGCRFAIRLRRSIGAGSSDPGLSVNVVWDLLPGSASQRNRVLLESWVGVLKRVPDRSFRLQRSATLESFPRTPACL